LPHKFLPAHLRLSHIGSAFRESRLLYLALKLPIEELANETDINADNLYRVLRALVSMGIFRETKPNVFANNRLSFLLCRTNKHNLHQHILNENNASKNYLWFNQLEARLCMHTDSQSSVIEHHFFIKGDSDSSKHVPIGKVNMFDGFDWSTFDLIFDSGNASGEHILDMFLSSMDLNICIYDKSAAIRHAKIFWQCEYIQDTNIRLSFEQGDMFKSLPKASSQHNLFCFVRVFSGKNCLTILNYIKVAMTNFKATVAIVDTILPVVGLDSSDALDDIQLLLENSGEHRTLNQWQKLLKPSGFSIVEVVDIRSSNKILGLRKT